MLRKVYPDLNIGYFHHIPFPSYELFRILPERAEILKGLLGADFIAFHTHDYMRHFISAVERVLRIDFKLDEAQLGNRVVRTDALPMGINYGLYHNASSRPEVRRAIDRTRKFFGNHKLILSVDRLDYSKGILHRLFLSFLIPLNDDIFLFSLFCIKKISLFRQLFCTHIADIECLGTQNKGLSCYGRLD